MVGKTQGSNAATYAYRFGDKLKAVTSNFPGETASVGYNYDGLGRRRLEQRDNTTATWFRWSGLEECGEYAGSVGSWTIGALQTGYVPGLATFAGSNPSTAAWRYHLTDHLGSVRQLSGQTKAALARYDYAPYGELLRNAGLPLTVGYTGHLWDSAIGQYYAPFRYYNPQTARWNMRDPLGFVDGPNVYAYVAGNPVLLFDRLGLNGTGWLCKQFKNIFWKSKSLFDEQVDNVIKTVGDMAERAFFGPGLPRFLNVGIGAIEAATGVNILNFRARNRRVFIYNSDDPNVSIPGSGLGETPSETRERELQNRKAIEQILCP